MHLPINIQTYIIKILYDYHKIYNTNIYLVNKHFFKIYKSLVGSYLGFFIDSQHNETQFQLFVKFVTSQDRLYDRPYFIYEKLSTLSICIFEDQYRPFSEEEGDHVIVRILSKLLKSSQWNEWNRELVNSTRNHGIDIEVIDPFCILGCFQFKRLRKSEQVTHLDISIDLDSTFGTPPPNIKTLSLKTQTQGFGEPDSEYENLINLIKKNCKCITKLKIASSYCSILPDSNSIELFKSLGGQLTRLEIFNKRDCFDNGFSDLVIQILKKHPNIKEFGYTEYDYPNSDIENDSRKIGEYLFSEECHIETITQLGLSSNSIPSIKRRIPFMIVRFHMVSSFAIGGGNDSDINKEVQQQKDKAILEFSNVDYLVLTYMNSKYDDSAKYYFLELTESIKDHNSSLNKMVIIYSHLMSYPMMRDNFKVLEISRYCNDSSSEDYSSDDEEDEDGNEVDGDGDEDEDKDCNQEDSTSS